MMNNEMHLNRWAIVENKIVYVQEVNEDGSVVLERNGKTFTYSGQIDESFERKADVLKPSKMPTMSAETTEKIRKRPGRKPMLDENGNRIHKPVVCPNKGMYGNNRGRPPKMDAEGNRINPPKVKREGATRGRQPILDASGFRVNPPKDPAKRAAWALEFARRHTEMSA